MTKKTKKLPIKKKPKAALSKKRTKPSAGPIGKLVQLTPRERRTIDDMADFFSETPRAFLNRVILGDYYDRPERTYQCKKCNEFMEEARFRMHHIGLC